MDIDNSGNNANITSNSGSHPDPDNTTWTFSFRFEDGDAKLKIWPVPRRLFNLPYGNILTSEPEISCELTVVVQIRESSNRLHKLFTIELESNMQSRDLMPERFDFKSAWELLERIGRTAPDISWNISYEIGHNPFGRQSPGFIIKLQLLTRDFTPAGQEPSLSLEELLHAYPNLKCRIRRPSNKNTGVAGVSATVSAAQLLESDGSMRPVERVIEEAICRKTGGSAKVSGQRFPWRLCLQLEEPQMAPQDATVIGNEYKGESVWRVRYLLQRTDDPSCLLSVPELLALLPQQSQRLSITSVQALSLVRSTLTPLTAACAAIQPTLKDKIPVGFELDTTGACEFVNKTADYLERAGVAIRVPRFCDRPPTKPKLRAQARITPLSYNILQMSSIVKFNWQLAIGDDVLTEEELTLLATIKAPLVWLRGRWVQLTVEDIQTAISYLKEGGKSEEPIRDAICTAFGGNDFAGVPVEGFVVEGDMKDLLAKLKNKAPPELSPPKLRCELRPYQRQGFSWLAFLTDLGLGACLADDMGLGKTIQTLALVQHRWDRNSTARLPVLLICPTSILGNWKQEAAKFTPGLPAFIHHGTTRDGAVDFAKRAKRHALVVTSYSLLKRDSWLFSQVQWGGIVFDEAQFIRNPDTGQTEAARTLKADWKIALTGTPIQNSADDLWSIMSILNPRLLGTRKEFRRRFSAPIHSEDQVASERLRELVQPFLLRRMKTDKTIISDLPEKMELNVYCTLTREQATLYKSVLNETESNYRKVRGAPRTAAILRLLTRLKQACNHPTHLLNDGSEIAERSGKLNRLIEMLEEIRMNGGRTLVFTSFKEMGAILQRHIQACFCEEVLFLHGDVHPKDRDQIVQRFQSDPKAPSIFVLTLGVGGVGLNLTRANYVVHFDRWWNPAVEDQASDRSYRIGQTRDVFVYRMICLGTLEARIEELLDKKRAVAQLVIGSTAASIASLPDEELNAFVRLEVDAITD